MPPQPIAPPREKSKTSGAKRGREEEKDEYEEIYEDVEVVRSVLIRFPCFDFFSHVGLCEEEQRAAEGGDTASDPIFRPDAVIIDKQSLTTEHPVLVLNKGTEKEMRFRGYWSDVDTMQHVTNRAVLCMKKHEAQEGDTVDATKSGDTQSTPNSSISPLTTASLFAHTEVGITSDDARLMRENKQSWYYDRIEVPCATLVMERRLA